MRLGKQGRGQSDVVILLHGLSRTSGSMRRIARALTADGFGVRAWDYPSRQHQIKALAEQFGDWLQRQDLGDRCVHFVGHSLGGILLRMVL